MTRKSEAKETKAAPQELTDKDLEQAKGGVGMLLPAVQKAPGPAATNSYTGTTTVNSGILV